MNYFAENVQIIVALVGIVGVLGAVFWKWDPLQNILIIKVLPKRGGHWVNPWVE
jgi:hypothetical protein